MTAPLVTRAAQGQLKTYAGTTLGWLIVDATGADAASTAMEFVTDAAPDELDDTTVTGYARGDIDVTWQQIDDTGTLIRNPAYTVPSTDTTDGIPAGVWFYDKTGGTDATNTLIAFHPVAIGAGFPDWDIDPVDGIASVGIEYTPGTPADWDTVPSTIPAALDEIATRLRALEA